MSKISMKYTWVDLLEGLDEIFADYGNRDMFFPNEEMEERFKNSNDGFACFTQEEAEEIFDFNEGDVKGTEEYLDGEELEFSK